MIQSWKDIQNERPDKWVALTDVSTEGSDIVSATVIDECSDSDLSSMKKKYRPINKDHHIWFARTTTGSIQYCVHLFNAHCEVV